jgi:VWFA-related protein
MVVALIFALLLFSWHSVATARAGVAPAQAGQTLPQSAPQEPRSTSQAPPQFQLNVESNLVVVRVVVRDSQGHPIGNLKKENFRLFDNRHEREITQFSVEMPSGGLGAPARPTASTEKAPATSAPAPAPRQIAFYFDDLNMALDEIKNARDAADNYLAHNLRTPDRAAIFASSGKVHTDFTSDLQTLHDALVRVTPIPNIKECPQISDYQAERIIEYEDPNAIRLAISDAKMRCDMLENENSANSGAVSQPRGSKGADNSGQSSSGGPGASQPSGMTDMPTLLTADPQVAFVKQEAEAVLIQSQLRTQRSLGMLNAIVLGMAHMDGQKEIILTSPGFLPRKLQEEVDRIIDRALNLQIVINSLDPKGVALLMPEVDVTSNLDAQFIDPQLLSLLNSFASSRELHATAVLAQIAEQTGGDFYHHNNDLIAGFARLVDEPLSYTLAFAPRNLDGKFHKLQVKLVKAEGTLQARSGYFAPKREHEAQTEERDQQAKQQDDELKQLMVSREELHQLAVDVSTEVDPVEGTAKKFRQLTVLVKLDLNSVRFGKEGEPNVNSLIFVVGIFDRKGKWLVGGKKQADLKLAELEDTRAVAIELSFQLKPGAYLLREIVQDSQDHHLSVINRPITIQ